MAIDSICRTELTGITPDKRVELLAKLQGAGYDIDEFGQIKPTTLSPDYPFISVDGNGFTSSARVPVTLGYVGSTFALLNNVDRPELDSYHAQLRVLYSQS